MEQEKDNPQRIVERLVQKLKAPGGLSRFTPELYDQLRQLSRRFMRREKAGHTWQPTEVVHEVFARLQQGQPDAYKDTQHFFATAAKHMHWVLIDHARRRRRKLESDKPRTNIEESVTAEELRNDQLMLELHEALLELKQLDAEAYRACELHYFGGHTQPEIAIIMGMAEATVGRRLRFAKAWLRKQIDPSFRLLDDDDDRIVAVLPGG